MYFIGEENINKQYDKELIFTTTKIRNFGYSNNIYNKRIIFYKKKLVLLKVDNLLVFDKINKKSDF